MISIAFCNIKFVLLILVVYDTGSPANVLFVDSDPLAEYSSIDKLSQPFGLSLNDMRDVIRHNMGLFSEDLSD